MKRKILSVLCLLLTLSLLLVGCADTATTGDGGSDTTADTGNTSDTTGDTGTQPPFNLSDVQRVELKGAQVRDGGEGCEVQVLMEGTKKDFDAYIAELEAQGFAKHAENKLSTNHFATYYSNKSIVNVIYDDYAGAVRVTTDSRENVVLPASSVEYTKICEPLLISVGLAADDADSEDEKNGLCYIFRLEDGSFIVYDGGRGNTANKMAEKIMKVLKVNAPDPENIVVSAWILTHAHSDHIGGFINFANNSDYREVVTVKSFILNTPNAEMLADCNMTANGSNLKNAMSKFKSADTIKAHPGQRIAFAGAELEVFYTLDLYDRETMSETAGNGEGVGGNTSSVITRLVIGGKSFLMTADMSEHVNDIVYEMYGSELKSDFVQVAHHGYQGAKADFYTRVSATYAIWPASKVGYEEMKNKQRNSWFLRMTNNSTSTKNLQLFIALDQIITIPLPYDGKTFTIMSTADYLAQ